MDNAFLDTKIGHIKPVMPNSILQPEKMGQQEEIPSFSKVLNDSIQSINNLQKNANVQAEKLARGEVQDVHQVVTAMQEANITFKLMMKVRSQILSAYKEISKGGA